MSSCVSDADRCLRTGKLLETGGDFVERTVIRTFKASAWSHVDAVAGSGGFIGVWVQLGGVSGEPMDPEARRSGQGRPRDLRSVVGSTVPEDHDRATADGPKEVAEERHHLRTADRALVDPEAEVTGWGYSTDRRELRPPALVNEHRCLADRRPSLPDVRDEREPALVDKHDDGPSPAGFFL